MKLTVLTQTNDIVNFDNILKITVFEGIYDDFPAYAIFAYPVGISPNEEDSDKLIQLGIFTDENNCHEAYQKLIQHIARGMDALFEVPVESGEDR